LNRFTEPVHQVGSEPATVTIDVHQHLWPEPLLAALARRRRRPRLLRRGDGWTLRMHGEDDWPVDLADHDPDRRLRALDARGIDRALVAPSVPLGIEALPSEESAPLIEAYHAGAAQLPARFRAWAALGLAEPDCRALDDLLDRGFVGACIAADALSGPAAVAALEPVLGVLERRGAPLFVHPGPSPQTLSAARLRGAPAWWPAMTRYVASMNAAWHAFGVAGRPAHPRLRVCFAMLAGLAPLQRERLVARGGRPVADPLTFVDTSSYGPRAVDAVIRELGVDALVHGSDLPVVAGWDLGFGDAVRAALLERNPARLLAPQIAEVAA
jgi:predicted TIM-barrel fold metal-dependent hydrolase